MAVAGLLCSVLLAPAALGEPGHAERDRAGGSSEERRAVAWGDGGHTRHSSDREPGPIAPYVASRDDTPLRRSVPTRQRFGPGVTYTIYDIGRTGAPLGVGASPRRGLLNARQTGWNQAFYLTRKGRPQFGELAFGGRIPQ